MKKTRHSRVDQALSLRAIPEILNAPKPDVRQILADQNVAQMSLM
jgi:hypothetical protein